MKNKKGCVLSFLLVFFICGVAIPLFMTNHTKVKADTITDLTGTTWIFNDYIDTTISSGLGITITSNGNNYYDVYVGVDSEDHQRNGRIYYATSNNDVLVFNSFSGDNWLNVAYKTITITGGYNATNSTVIQWIQANATQQTTGTQILYKYWAPDGIIRMTDNQVLSDNEIEYTVLFNEYNRSYDETTQTGLIFKGVQTQQDPAYSYIQSINGQGINILYLGNTNNINNTMWLEFTYGDYMDSDLYDFMDLWGYWFDDSEAYLVGTNQGLVEGKEIGRALGQADGVQYTGLVTGIFNGLGGLLNIQVFPNITLGLIIGLPLLLGALIIILKILRG